MYKSIHLLVIIVLFFVSHVFSQENKVLEADFQVSGNCEMCKIRIENAASIAGVKKVAWNKETQNLRVFYRKDKVSLEEIHQAIANSGHDTEKIKAKNEDYEKIPHCCSYRENQHIH